MQEFCNDECEEGISVQFYTKKYLKSKPVNRNHGIGFIGGADKPTALDDIVL